MKAPRLTSELVLETRERLSDGAGGYTEHWTAIGTLWAALDARSGRETGGEAGQLALTAWRIIVRGAPEGATARPVPGQRFALGARRFPILAVAERDPAGRFLTCYAEEETAT